MNPNHLGCVINNKDYTEFVGKCVINVTPLCCRYHFIADLPGTHYWHSHSGRRRQWFELRMIAWFLWEFFFSEAAGPPEKTHTINLFLILNFIIIISASYNKCCKEWGFQLNFCLISILVLGKWLSQRKRQVLLHNKTIASVLFLRKNFFAKVSIDFEMTLALWVGHESSKTSWYNRELWPISLLVAIT